MPPNGTNLTITNPLVLYRSLIATGRVKPDPAQHRLALHLQKLYDRLIDYEPSIEYSDRLRLLSRSIATSQHASSSRTERAIIGTRGIWTSLLAQKEKRNSVALTRVLTSHEAAMDLQSPKGLMLHGEVGTGKSMLVDLFADCLPNRKKRRWHFNTFMLETFSRLELLRKSRLSSPVDGLQDEYSLLWLARDLVEKSPILFLDEFQLPDRAAAKILSNLMTSFFQLGGVLVATSNRMPEELAKAAGMDFSRPVSKLSRLGWTLGMRGSVGRDDGPGQLGEFGQFLELLRARCEVWEMEGKKDYRRLKSEDGVVQDALFEKPSADLIMAAYDTASGLSPTNTVDITTADTSETALPKYYLVAPPPIASNTDISTHETSLASTLHALTSTPPSRPLPWEPAILEVYGRSVPIPAQNSGTALFTFNDICGASFGPADFITLASTYHTIAITDVPIMGFLQKNEARRLITLLDAMYEARCRLLITAVTGPDDLFFPTTTSISTPDDPQSVLDGDAVHPETYSEIHQDLTSPFRPNISSYTSSDSSFSSLPQDALEDDPPNRIRKPESSYTDERKLGAEGAKAPNFANVRGLTGEDEVFAVKRAESRIWEMCSARWWDRASSSSDTTWWRPLPRASRHWETSSRPVGTALRDGAGVPPNTAVLADAEHHARREDKLEELFANEASPFRTVTDAPPMIDWTHIWGAATWGKRAGAWGKGPAGLTDRRKDKDGIEGDGKGNADK